MLPLDYQIQRKVADLAIRHERTERINYIMIDTINVGVIGVGFIGPCHIDALRRLGYVNVVALADPAAPEEKARQLYIPRGAANYLDLMADDSIQVIHNCTPNYLHFQVSKAALEAGKHVISEKPVAMTAAEAGELTRLAEENGLVNAVCFNYRYFPLPQHMRAMVRTGEMGQIWLVHGRYLQDWLFYDTDYNWRLLPEYSGASRAVADIGSHWLDLAQHVTGSQVRRVFADLATIHPIRKRPVGEVETFASQSEMPTQSIEIETEDYASILLHFDNGAMGVCTVSQVSAGHKCNLALEINGSKQSAAWNQERPNELWLGYRDRANQVMLRDPALMLPEARPYTSLPGGHGEAWMDGLYHLMRNIYSFIQAGHHPRTAQAEFPTFRSGWQINAIVEAILTSHREERWVDVPVI